MEAKKTTRYTHSFLKKVSSIRGWSQFHGLGRVSCIYLGTRKSKAFGKRLSQGRHRVIFKRFRLFLRSSNPRTAPPTNCFSIRMNESTCIRHFDTKQFVKGDFVAFNLCWLAISGACFAFLVVYERLVFYMFLVLPSYLFSVEEDAFVFFSCKNILHLMIFACLSTRTIDILVRRIVGTLHFIRVIRKLHRCKVWLDGVATSNFASTTQSRTVIVALPSFLHV